MTAKGPLDLVVEMAKLFDDLRIPYALGGSMASSLVGEPRTTVDVDIAVQLTFAAGEALLERASADFYVPLESARAAIGANSSFNLLDTEHSMKVDLFVLGEDLLDRMQIERRILIDVAGDSHGIWVTSIEDQVLRKLDWFRQGDSISDRQWRDIVGILAVNRDRLDTTYLREIAAEVNLTDLLATALSEA